MNLSVVSTYRWNTTISVGSVTTATVNISDLNEFQPYYYDQLMTIYKNWVVVSAEVEYRVINKSVSSEGQLVTFEINRKNFDSGMTLPIAESLPGAQRYLMSSTGNQKVLTIRRQLDLKKFYPKKFDSDSDFWGDFYTSPPICSDATRKDNILSVLMYTAADGSSSPSFTTDRRITFHVRFFNFWAQNISATGVLAVEDEASHPNREPEIVPNKNARSTPCTATLRKRLG
jgi:hypothetical protein